MGDHQNGCLLYTSFGKLYKKPTIGDAQRPVEYEDIRRVNRLMYAAIWLALLIAAAIAAALEFCI